MMVSVRQKQLWWLLTLLTVSLLTQEGDGVSRAGSVLSADDLRLVFGDGTAVPNYDVFEAEVRWGTNVAESEGERYRRDADSNSHLQFTALGRDFNFRLQLNNDIISPNFVALSRKENETEIRNLNMTNFECYYQGVDDTYMDDDTKIAVELCGRVRGVITSSNAEYVIEPLPQSVTRRRRRSSSLGSDALLQSSIIYEKQRYTECSSSETENPRYRRSPASDEERARAAMGSREARRPYFSSDELEEDSRLRSEWGYGGAGGSWDDDRYRDTGNSPAEDLYIETAVFVDRDLYRHMEGNFPRDTEDQVLNFVLALVNAVQLLYNDPSLGHRVKFVLKRLEIQFTDPQGLHRPYDIDTFLTNFCTWQRQENPSRDSDPLHWDHALILTGLDVFTITSRGRVNSEVVGLAPVAGMCTRSSSCTVNEGRHFESVYVVAHEIGHNLGMRHDGLQAGNNCDSGRYLMSPTLGSGKITWSPCSRRYLDVFLRTKQSDCLRDRTRSDSTTIDHERSSLPGQRFSADQQCMLKHGVGSHHADSQRLEEICQDLHCRRDHYTWTSHPALEGTTCGHTKWCRRGKCEEDSDAPTLHTSSSVHSSSSTTLLGSSSSWPGSSGVGGEWGPWSECTSDCLYGVDGILSSGSTGLSLSERRCRSPRQCRGEYRFRVCSAVQECSSGQRRTLQDFADDICSGRARRNPALLTGLSARIPQTGLSKCDVECETSGRGVQISGRSFPDGTVCISPTSFPAYCVAGVCTEFRCEPNTLYGADPVTCRPDMGAPDPHRPLGPSQTSGPWSTTARPFGNNDYGWGPWRPASACRFSCLTSARGIQLVTRECRGRHCEGVAKNIQVCTPTNSDCNEVKNTFQYASEVCGRYQRDVDQLSGVGMQLSSTTDDPDRACTVACQDAHLDYRFYKVNGRDGWFPFGTDCARGNEGRSAYCLNGKCLDFSDEGTPMRTTIYSEYENSRARSLNLEDPIERAIPLEVRGPPVRWYEGRRRRDVTTSSHPISSTISDHLLLTLVNQFNDTMLSTTRASHPPSSIDLRNPLFVGDVPAKKFTLKLDPDSFRVKPLNPSEGENSTVKLDDEKIVGHQYQWKVLVSPCSVTCGKGIEEVLVICVSDEIEEVPVNAKGCQARGPPPEKPRFQECDPRRSCPQHTTEDNELGSSFVRRWLNYLLEEIRSV